MNKNLHNNKEIERNREGIAIIKINTYEFLIDDDNWHSFNLLKWRLKNNKYASTSLNKQSISLHQIVLNKKEGFVIDHINRNTFDNRRINLRHVTHSINNHNKIIKSDNKTSKYNGVYLIKQSKIKPWCAKISFNNKTIYIGLFETENAAAKAYNEKALEIYGNNALLNILE